MKNFMLNFKMQEMIHLFKKKHLKLYKLLKLNPDLVSIWFFEFVFRLILAT